MIIAYLAGIFLLSILLATVIIPRILFISYKKRLFDVPDSRKVHKTPIPRLGGLSFLPVILIALCSVTGIRYYTYHPVDMLWASDLFIQYLFLIVGLTLLYLVGVADDLVGVGYRYKFVIQILAALLFPLSGLWINDLGGLLGLHEIPAYIGMPLTVFLTVYITNAINLIDGIDGLASGLSCIALGLLIIQRFRQETIHGRCRKSDVRLYTQLSSPAFLAEDTALGPVYDEPEYGDRLHTADSPARCRACVLFPCQ